VPIRHPKDRGSVAETGRPAVCEEPAQQPGHKPGVLVVESDALVRIMLRAGLERHGFRVWLAPDGAEALDLYREHREAIAVVLLAVRLPGLDGPHTLDALRERDPQVRACFLSDDTDGYQPVELHQRGARFVFTTPFLLDDLAQTLGRLAQGVPTDRVPSDIA
jgi:CheY-like chemotaxis protein